MKCLRYTIEYLNLLNQLPQLPAPKNLNIEKVYFSRVAFQLRKDCNEQDVENCFKKQGFTIIYPEKLDFLTALAILQNCKVFAATDGSIAHNLIFCKNKITAIICRKSRNFTGYQITINNLKEANVFYIDTAFSPFADWNKGWVGGPFFLYETKYLRRYFGLPPKKIFPFWKFFKYCLFFVDSQFFVWSHPLRAKLQIGTRLRKLFKIPKR